MHELYKALDLPLNSRSSLKDIEVEVDFATEVSRTVRLGVGHLFGAYDQILIFL
jgi:hypothetical protein